MTRREFLRGLEEALQMNVPSSVIRNQLSFYDRYIADELAKGRSEKEIMDELGDPRLLAKTIEEATDAGAGQDFTDGEFRESTAAYTEADSTAYESSSASGAADEDWRRSSGQGAVYTEGEQPSDGGRFGGRGAHHFGSHRSVQVNGTLGCLLSTIILLAVLSLIGALFSALAPILIPAVVVLVILWLLKGIMDR